MAYSTVADLLIGDLPIGGATNPQAFVDTAAEEMDSKLGWLYATPIAWEGGDGPRHEVLLLKQINNKLASGRLILTLAIAEEGTSLHAYGLRLVTEATTELMLIANGDVDLTATKAESGDVAAQPIPGVRNYDDESLLLGFEENVLRGRGDGLRRWYTRPGQVA